MAKKKTKIRVVPTTLAQLRHENEYHRIAGELREDRFSEARVLPLAYWTRPADRQLPLVFMNWPLKRLLKLRFDEVLDTSGVGEKKIVGLLKLLRRITQNGHAIESEMAVQAVASSQDAATDETESFDAGTVSEAQWQQWSETVERHELNQLPIGRVMRSLSEVPVVIWDTPLGRYNGRTLAEVRKMKTHGHKRVRIILESFWIAHSTLKDTSPHEHILIEIVPRFVRHLESWIEDQLESTQVPTVREMRDGLVRPLLNQIEIDVGERIAAMVRDRLGLDGVPVSVRSQARDIGVTRARVYQWLEECAAVMRVRWPTGRWKVRMLSARLGQSKRGSESQELLATLSDIFFPEL